MMEENNDKPHTHTHTIEENDGKQHTQTMEENDGKPHTRTMEEPRGTMEAPLGTTVTPPRMMEVAAAHAEWGQTTHTNDRGAPWNNRDDGGAPRNDGGCSGSRRTTANHTHE